MNKLMVIAAVGLLAGPTVARAATVCEDCEYVDSAAGTYLGSYNAGNLDLGTFQHSDLGIVVGPATSFEDRLVFDFETDGDISISGSFTPLTSISGFSGRLYDDAGSICSSGTPGSCIAIATSNLRAFELQTNGTWTITANDLPAGRYVIEIGGLTNANSTSAYTGQVSSSASDSDADGVSNTDDQCADTSIPESAPTSGQLGAGRYALTRPDNLVFAKGPKTKGTYDTSDTAGCSCEQIVAALGLGSGQLKYGCSKGEMEAWILSLP